MVESLLSSWLTRRFVFTLLLTFPLAASSSDALWSAHIEPLLKQHCADCHNATKTKSGLDVSSFPTLLRGGERGSALVPGRPDESNVYRFLSSDADPHMPPGKRKPLTAEEIGLIKKWIEELPVVTVPKSESTTNAPVTPDPSISTRVAIAWKPPADMPPWRVVDRYLELAWQRDKVEPTKRIDRPAFARRVYLDLAGRTPSVEETAAFVDGKVKRSRLVESLLDGPDYARHMRDVFDAVLMGRRGANWEEKRADNKWFEFLEESFRTNRRWDEVVRDLIVARPERPEDRGALWYLYERQNNAQAIAESLAPVVFGLQVKCAQCHDHMIAREIKQAHYWAMVAAFNRSKNVDTPRGLGVAESAIGGFASFANLKKESQPALLTFFNGRNVPEVRPTEKEVDDPDLYLVAPPKPKSKPEQPSVPKFSRRAAFAEVATVDNPLLARAMVNRIWALLFGRGIVHPVDLMDSKHPPSHPELLDWLSEDFAKSNYDVKRLLRVLCNSKAYHLDSRWAPAGKSGPPPSPDLFARGLDKPLSAEQLFRALLTTTGNKPDSEGKVAGRSERELRRAFVGQFPDLFAPEYNATLYQAMFMANSDLFDQLLIPRGDNLSARLAQMSAPEVRVQMAFSEVMGRAPDHEESKECTSYLAGRTPEAGVKQLLWALLSSAEFQLNH